MGLITDIKLMYLRYKHNPAEAINNALDKTSAVIETTGKALAEVQDLYCTPENENTPQLPDDIYNRFEIYLGTSKANEVKRNVEAGIMKPQEAEEFIHKIELVREHSEGRRDIEPEAWQDFEDGWRPEGWYD